MAPTRKRIDNTNRSRRLSLSDEELAFDADVAPKPIDELGANQCRWPVNQSKYRGGHLFCGRHAELGRSYCDEHNKRAGPYGSAASKDGPNGK